MRRALPFPPRKVSFRPSSAPLAAALAAAPLALTACLTLGTGAPPADDGSEEENAEPTYQVYADQTESNCGVGTITLEKSWSFAATLTVDEDGESVTFNTGGGDHEGDLDEDGSFEVVAEIEVNMRTADSPPDLPPCSIRRTDTLKGKLDDPEDPTSFEGTLSFEFEPTTGSDCTDQLYNPEPLVEQLPCEADYVVQAEIKE